MVVTWCIAMTYGITKNIPNIKNQNTQDQYSNVLSTLFIQYLTRKLLDSKIVNNVKTKIQDKIYKIYS